MKVRTLIAISLIAIAQACLAGFLIVYLGPCCMTLFFLLSMLVSGFVVFVLCWIFVAIKDAYEEGYKHGQKRGENIGFDKAIDNMKGKNYDENKGRD
jgi:hypothetical protein